MSSYEIGIYLGWLNAFALSLLFMRYFEPTLFKKSKPAHLFFRKTHLITAVLLITSGLIHSALVWGSLEFHTGQLLIGGIIITAMLGFVGKRKKYAHWFMIHKVFAAITLMLLIIHLYNVLSV